MTCTNLNRAEQSQADAADKTRGGVTYSPRVDISETDQELLLHADLPGVAPEDLDVNFENRELTISGKVTPRHQELNPVCREYGIGDFHRSFTVGEEIDAEKISAELTGGELTLRLPKSESKRPRRIEVKSG